MNLCRKSASFNPDTDVPPLTGKTILVTGGNIGLGKQAVLEYAKHNPALIWLAARSLEKGQASIDDIQSQLSSPANIKLLQLDLASLESVRNAAHTVLHDSNRLDILMLNAGIMATPPGLTKDGYENQFGTNYLGHALLAKLLTPLLAKTAALSGSDVRAIMVTSVGHQFAPKPEGIRYSTLRTTADDHNPYTRYGQSKLAQILWAREAASRFPQLTVTSVHPGLVSTNLMSGATDSPWYVRGLVKVALAGGFAASVDQGVKNQLWASVSKGVVSGSYYEPVGVGGLGSEFAKDDVLARRLWEWTEEELKTWSI